MSDSSVVTGFGTIRKNITKFLSFHGEFEVVEAFGSVEDFEHKKSIDPGFTIDVLLLDIGLPGVSGIEGIPVIKGKLPDLDIIILTTYEEEDMILRDICAGACSYLSKKASLDEILECVRVGVNGGSYMSPSIAREIVNNLMGGRISKATILSDRQKQILLGLVGGKTDKTIGKELFISPDTVKGHIKKMYRTLQVNNKAEAMAMYLRGEIK